METFMLAAQAAVRPTWSAKISVPEIFSQHGRHAALEARRGEPKIVVNSRDSRVVLGTFFVQLGPRKFGERNFLQSTGATQRLKHDAGSQKEWEIPGFAGCLGTFVVARLSSEPSSSKGGPRKFWNQKFRRSVGATQRLKHDAGSQSPTWSAKILATEIFEKHGRHAAFRLRRGGARAKSSRYIAPGFARLRGRGRERAKYRRKRPRVLPCFYL